MTLLTSLGKSCFSRRFVTSSSLQRGFASVGDQLPSVDLHLGFPPEKHNLADFAKDKAILLVGLPGAFTPTWYVLVFQRTLHCWEIYGVGSHSIDHLHLLTQPFLFYLIEHLLLKYISKNLQIETDPQNRSLTISNIKRRFEKRGSKKSLSTVSWVNEFGLESNFFIEKVRPTDSQPVSSILFRMMLL